MIRQRYILLSTIVVLLFIGVGSLVLKHPFNFSGDPFGASPRGSSPNCGPEQRYKFDTTINTERDFVNFIKNNQINPRVELDNFKDSASGEVNWDTVEDSITTERIGGRIVYMLDYNPFTCSGFTLKMTNDGHVSDYGCCGK